MVIKILDVEYMIFELNFLLIIFFILFILLNFLLNFIRFIFNMYECFFMRVYKCVLYLSVV